MEPISFGELTSSEYLHGVTLILSYNNHLDFFGL